ncbi:MAG: 4Fe-4S binding protein, partial [Candidatus Rifleibacteriota bacterium]
GTPCLRTGTSFCRFCADFPCINACPTGALNLVSAHDRIGLAKANPETCLRSQGQECSACCQMCDRTFKAIRLTETGKPPAVDREKCTGCGACVTVCPVTPVPAIRITGDW